MGKVLNEKVTGAKGTKAERTLLMNSTRETVTDFIGDVLANEYGKASLVEIANGGIEDEDGKKSKVTKKKYLFVTSDGVQLQVQVTAKEKDVELTDENILATYTADVVEEEEEVVEAEAEITEE